MWKLSGKWELVLWPDILRCAPKWLMFCCWVCALTLTLVVLHWVEWCWTIRSLITENSVVLPVSVRFSHHFSGGLYQTFRIRWLLLNKCGITPTVKHLQSQRDASPSMDSTPCTYVISADSHWSLNEMSEHHPMQRLSSAGRAYVARRHGLRLCVRSNPAEIEGFSLLSKFYIYYFRQPELPNIW